MTSETNTTTETNTKTATIQPATTLAQGDTMTVPLRVLDVKASDHAYFGPHDIINVEVTEATGDIPAGLRLQMRRPHDGSNDLRSSPRKRRNAASVDVAPVAALPEPSWAMTRNELIALADARGIDTGAKPTKAKLLTLLS